MWRLASRKPEIIISFSCNRFNRYFTTQGNPTDLRIGKKAVEKLMALNKENAVKQHLRVQIDAGGCHGYQYKMELTPDIREDDIVFREAESTFLTDALTLDMIKGGKLDWVEELIESSFQIVENPNAESSCGCKVSFNIKI